MVVVRSVRPKGLDCASRSRTVLHQRGSGAPGFDQPAGERLVRSASSFLQSRLTAVFDRSWLTRNRPRRRRARIEPRHFAQIDAASNRPGFGICLRPHGIAWYPCPAAGQSHLDRSRLFLRGRGRYVLGLIRTCCLGENVVSSTDLTTRGAAAMTSVGRSEGALDRRRQADRRLSGAGLGSALPGVTVNCTIPAHRCGPSPCA